jgi:serine/threonine protein kinase
VIQACLQCDPHQRPSAATLLKHDFFASASRARIEQESKKSTSGTTESKSVETEAFVKHLSPTSLDQINRDVKKVLENLRSWRFRLYSNPVYKANCICCLSGNKASESFGGLGFSCECNCHSDGSTLSRSDAVLLAAAFRIPVSWILRSWASLADNSRLVAVPESISVSPVAGVHFD